MQDVESVQVAYVRFKKLPVGHVFFIFRRADGQEVALSAEARPDSGSFSLLRGFFKAYRLRYYQWDPAALAKKYIEQGRHVIARTLNLTSEERAQLYKNVLERGRELEERSEWYHPVSNSCVNSVVDHLDKIRGRKRHLPAVLLIFMPHRLFQL